MKTKLFTMASLAALFAVSAAPVFAVSVGSAAGIGLTAAVNANASGTNISADASAAAKVNATADIRITTRANQEITRRMNALNALITRASAMQKLSSEQKTSLSSSIQAQIATLTALQVKITADASDTTQLRTDAQTITSSYRIFALILPQGAIEAAADRVLTIVDSMNTLATPLQARITAAQSAGDNVSTEITVLADMQAKTTDAQTQANAAVSETASLKPDGGNQTVLATNTAALKDARTKIQTAQKDLTDARKDAGTIVKALLSMNVSMKMSATSTMQMGASSTSGTAQ